MHPNERHLLFVRNCDDAQYFESMSTYVDNNRREFSSEVSAVFDNQRAVLCKEGFDSNPDQGLWKDQKQTCLGLGHPNPALGADRFLA